VLDFWVRTMKYKFYLIGLLGFFMTFGSDIAFNSDIYYIGRMGIIIGSLAVIFGIRANIRNMYSDKICVKNHESDPIKRMLNKKNKK